jgi:gas vesicle protein
MSPSQNEIYTTEFLVGVLAGMLVGGVLAVWYAPQSGQTTRDNLARWFHNQTRMVAERVQGESVAQSLETGRAIAHSHRAEQAKRLPSG